MSGMRKRGKNQRHIYTADGKVYGEHGHDRQQLAAGCV